MITHQASKVQQTNPQMLISYMLLRKLIGSLAFLLPIVLAFGGIFYGSCELIEKSISDYYHTEMRNVLVGTLCTVALFMFTYVGHDWRDATAGNIACVSALSIAFFPTNVNAVSNCATNCIIYDDWIGIVHLISALLFFIVLIYFSLKLFPLPRDKKETLTIQKKKRNTIYHICGYIMIACIVFIIIYFWKFDENPKFQKLKPVFWLELIALWAFGLSWLTKGQLFLKDNQSVTP